MSLIDVHFSEEKLANPAFFPETKDFIGQYAENLQCEAKPFEAGLLLLPEYMKRIYGIFALPQQNGWQLSREYEATTWEDYLLVKLAHNLAAQFGGMIFLGSSLQPLSLEPERFESFDSYAETVLGDAQGLLRQTKKTWIYAHQNRVLR